MLGVYKVSKAHSTQGGLVPQKGRKLSENTGLCGSVTAAPALPPRRWPWQEQPTIRTSEETESSSFLENAIVSCGGGVGWLPGTPDQKAHFSLPAWELAPSRSSYPGVFWPKRFRVNSVIAASWGKAHRLGQQCTNQKAIWARALTRNRTGDPLVHGGQCSTTETPWPGWLADY